MREKSMLRKGLMATAVLVALLALPIDPPSAQIPRRTTGVSLDSMVEPIRVRFELPALAAAVVQNGRIVAAGAVGTRRAGTTIPVTLDDRFHIGSDTKAMTALLAAMLIEQGKLDWKTTVAEIFPELTNTMAADVGGIRLDQLLSH